MSPDGRQPGRLEIMLQKFRWPIDFENACLMPSTTIVISMLADESRRGSGWRECHESLVGEMMQHVVAHYRLPLYIVVDQ